MKRLHFLSAAALAGCAQAIPGISTIKPNLIRAGGCGPTWAWDTTYNMFTLSDCGRDTVTGHVGINKAGLIFFSQTNLITKVTTAFTSLQLQAGPVNLAGYIIKPAASGPGMVLWYNGVKIAKCIWNADTGLWTYIDYARNQTATARTQVMQPNLSAGCIVASINLAQAVVVAVQAGALDDIPIVNILTSIAASLGLASALVAYQAECNQ